MSITLVLQEASGSFAATSGRILEVSSLGDSPTILETFSYSLLTFASSGGFSVDTYTVTGAVSGNYYAYQWGNAGGWSLTSPWIKGSGLTLNTCLVYGTSYDIDGSAASGANVSGTYNDSKGIITSLTMLGRKSKGAVVASDGTWSMELLQGAKVKFTHSRNPKLNAEGVVPSTDTADINSFAVNI